MSSLNINRTIGRRGLGALALTAGLAAFVAPAGTAAADSSNCSQLGRNVACTYTAQGESQFVVPAGVSSLTATVVGAQGNGPIGTAGGLGAQASGTLAVTPGATMYAEVDVLGGGPALFAGGGESDVRTCSAAGTCPSGGTLDSRLLVAGGGGGAGDAPGGNAGPTGANGDGSTTGSRGGASGGGGATQSTYGSGGSGGQHDPCFGYDGSNGAFGAGGHGAPGDGTNECAGDDGGGGGGGWYGGGGGGGGGDTASAGGGGGSSYADPSVSEPKFSQASAGQAASVTISYVLPDTTPPGDQPVISGTKGDNGWYTSDVSVAWNWTDAGSGVDTSNCTQSDISSGEGSSVTLAASCQDLAGNAASDSVTVKIDKTAPTVSCATPAPAFAIGGTGAVSASVSDALSGPAQATVSAPADTSTAGAKSTTLTGQDNAGNSTSVTCPYTVGYGFGGFTAPLPKSTLTRSGSTIPVKFTLTDGSGHPIAAGTAAALASAGKVRVTLAGPVISAQTALCSWNSSERLFQCNIKTPSGLLTGTGNPYTITAAEDLGGGFVTVPQVGSRVNPATVYFK